MKIINNQNYFTNEQINKITKYLGKDYTPKKIIIYETRLDLIKILKNTNILLNLYGLLNIRIWLGKLEGYYHPTFNLVVIFVFSQTYDGDDKQSKQLYSLHVLLHELRHRWQIVNKYKGDREIDADDFAMNFINNKSELISGIMNWEDEWEIEEE